METYEMITEILELEETNAKRNERIRKAQRQAADESFSDARQSNVLRSKLSTRVRQSLTQKLKRRGWTVAMFDINSAYTYSYDVCVPLLVVKVRARSWKREIKTILSIDEQFRSWGNLSDLLDEFVRSVDALNKVYDETKNENQKMQRR